MEIAINKTSGTVSSQEEKLLLLPLRNDLQLMEAPRTRDGTPGWTLFDKVRQLFFRISRVEFKMLFHWKTGITAEELCEKVNKKENLNIDVDSVKKFVQYLTGNQLLTVQSSTYTEYLLNQFRSGKGKVFTKLLHHYLFFRIPLIRPDRFLEAALPAARLLVSKFIKALFCVAAISGLFLISRQWEAFQQTYLYFFNLEGLIWYGVTIVFVKIAHESGHAFTAKHFGVRVPTMGVAFLVLMPILYTDVTDAWKLTSRRARLWVTGAGVTVELCIALIAIFLWSFLPDGALKSAAFFVATVSSISTLLLNLNPFMRFDGYYLLSDWFEMPNLQNRSFAFGKWWLRNFLFGLCVPPPEALPRATRRWLIIYAISVWMYRAVLFVSIAFMVYFLFFKLLGIFLMIVELAWFVVRPVWNEMKAWYNIRKKVTWNRASIRTSILFLGIGALLVFPWQSSFKRDAFIRPAVYTNIYSPEPGKIEIVNVKTGDEVSEGSLLFALESPELEFKKLRTDLKVRAVQWYLERNKTTSDLIEYGSVLEGQLAEALAKQQGFSERLQSLKIKAPFDGKVVRLENTVVPGRWLNPRLPLLLLADKKQVVIETYIPEENLGRIGIGGNGRFFPENPDEPFIDATIIEIDSANTKILNEPLLASTYGGDIAVNLVDGELKNHESLYKVILKPDRKITELKKISRGTLKLSAKRKSILKGAWRHVVSVFIRESSF